MFDLVGSSATLSEARQEFLFACALHQLIPEQSIEVLLGDVPMQSLPASGRYTKDQLVAQCTVNPGRVEELIEEIENLEGNAGEIAAALIDVSEFHHTFPTTTVRSQTLKVAVRWIIVSSSSQTCNLPQCNMSRIQQNRQPYVYSQFRNSVIILFPISYMKCTCRMQENRYLVLGINLARQPSSNSHPPSDSRLQVDPARELDHGVH